MTYTREKDGKRFIFDGGLDTVNPPDLTPPGHYPFLQNVRKRKNGRIGGRPPTGNALYTLPAVPHSLQRMNYGNSFVRVIGAAGSMYVNAAAVASGFSGNPVSLVSLEPGQSVQPWMYVGDSSQAVTIPVTDSTSQLCTGMVKIRSDALTRKTGIKEPQYPPIVGINTVSVTQWLSLPADTPPWTNINGANPNQNYSGTDTQPPYPATIATPVSGATIILTVTGSATVNGTVHSPGDSGPSTAGYPGDFIATPLIVVYAFTDANGNIIAQATAMGSPPVLGNVGAGVTLTVPVGAAQLQIGIDSAGGTFSANSGAFLIEAVVSTSAISTAASIVGLVTAYVWGDSPHSGPVAGYIWKNPNDSGTGIARTIGTAQASAQNNSLIFDSSPEDGTVPVLWSTLLPNSTVSGTIDLFSPAFESEGYQDFNACVVGQIFFPAGGTYSVQVQNKDQVMFGMGGGITSTGGAVYGVSGQSITVVNGLPLLYVSAIDGSGGAATETISINVPAKGVYQFEFDWDYWEHTGRSMIVEMSPTPGAGVATIPPQPPSVRLNVQYWVKYRALESGARSNPSPPSPVELTPVLANTIQAPYSPDPQVTVYDLYRQDDELANPTYVNTGPNDGLGGTINGVVYNTAIEDTLSDAGAANNPTMDLDDFEPFPSIGAPLSGRVSIIDGVINWVSGDKFPLNMLPGTIMLVGSPAQDAYSLIQRPLSVTQIVIPDIPDNIGNSVGAGVPYNIAQPILAQQPLPSMWGPDAYGFVHACGDTNQPGAYKWTKAYNPDSAPDTNTLLLTSPSEALMGGSLVNGVSMVFSTQRAWLMYPNFADAVATTTGTQGNQWNPILALEDEGLYIRNCLCSLGGKGIAYRVSGGIKITSGTGGKSITDETLFNLFPHENFTPQPVTAIGPYTVFPPNDSLPQKLSFQNGYIYWDYQDSTSVPRTLVYDLEGKGWTVDVGVPVFTVHASEYAPGVNDTAVGCSDGSIRVLQAGGTEAAVSVVATGAENGGDARALKRISDVFVRAVAQVSGPISVALYSSQYATALSGFSPTSLTGSGALSPYILDWGTNQPQDVSDVEMILTWPTASGSEIDLWQPGFTELPIGILSRVTEGMTHGFPSYQSAYLANLMYYAPAPVTLTLNTDQGNFSQTFPAGGSLFVPVKVALNMPPNKFKVCTYQLSSAAPWFRFDCEVWVGAWGRQGAYAVVHPFDSSNEPGASQ